VGCFGMGLGGCEGFYIILLLFLILACVVLGSTVGFFFGARGECGALRGGSWLGFCVVWGVDSGGGFVMGGL
jgi:hypothetical protein